MKKYLSLLIMLALVLLPSLALAWKANANVLVHPLEVRAVVYNQLNTPIKCSGKVFGRLSSGHMGWARFNAIIPPGMNAYAYVYTNVNNPFVTGWSNINCSSH